MAMIMDAYEARRELERRRNKTSSNQELLLIENFIKAALYADKSEVSLHKKGFTKESIDHLRNLRYIVKDDGEFWKISF